MAQSRPNPSNSPIFQLLMKIRRRPHQVEAIALVQHLNARTVDDLAKYSVQYLEREVGVTSSTISSIENVMKNVYHTSFSPTYEPSQTQTAQPQPQATKQQRRAGGSPPLSPYQQAGYVSLDNFVE